MASPTTLVERLDYLQNRIEKAAICAKRKPKEITLIGITKSFKREIWEQALNVNLTTLGESRIQEAQEKSEAFIKRNKIELHLIGHLQSNKARKAVEVFDVIQTVDSIKLGGRINSICKQKHQKQQLYLQVNTGEDPNKHGISPKNVNTIANEITNMENVTLEGIMTIPPQNCSTAELILIYKKTRKIRDEIRTRVNETCKYISMGMSNDYEIAIKEGATFIRIGRKLFQ